MSLQSLPFVPARWFDNSGDALAGGFLWFYLRGTSTPATGSLWKDPDKLAAWSNPVQLDGAGHADIFLDPGVYTVVLKDYSGVQVSPPVDVMQAAGGFGGGEGGTARMVANYAAVRALSTAYDALYVLGRTTEGDGGEGWFQRVTGSVETDDDGAVLVAGVVRYKRPGMVALSPRWYGVVYGATVAQDAALAKALDAAGTGKRGLPVLVDGSIYLGADTTIAAGVALQFASAGEFVSGVGGVVLTFAAGSKIEGAPFQAFGSGVQPKFPTGTRNPRLSWMGGSTGDDRLTKLAACSTQGIVAVLDDSVSISTNITFPANLSLDVAGGLITVTSHADLTIPSVVYLGRRQWVSYANISAVGAVAIGPGPIPPEWFGAVGDGVADDSVALLAAMSSGWALLDRSYRLTQALSFSGNMRCDGPLIDCLYTSETLPSGSPSAPPAIGLLVESSGSITAAVALQLFNLSIKVATGHAAGSLRGNYLTVFVGCYVQADTGVSIPGTAKSFWENSVLPSSAWGSDLSRVHWNSCRFTSGPFQGRVHSVSPRLIDALLSGTVQFDDIKNQQLLGTDANGFIVAGSISPSLRTVQWTNVAVWTDGQTMNAQSYLNIVDNSAAQAVVTLPAPPSGQSAATLMRVVAKGMRYVDSTWRNVLVNGAFVGGATQVQLTDNGSPQSGSTPWADFLGWNGAWYRIDGGQM